MKKSGLKLGMKALVLMGKVIELGEERKMGRGKIGIIMGTHV